MNGSKAATLTEYLNAIDAVIADWKRADGNSLTPWFRGVKGSANELCPALYRGRFASLGPGDEADLMQEFKRVAPSLRHGLPHHTRYIDWLAIAQHHGLPTRMLDWTESSLAALFFALESTREDQGPVQPGVWMLNPDWLNRRAGVADRVLILTEEPENQRLDECWGALRGDRCGQEPIAIRPVQLATRVAAQSGVFTLFGTRRQSLDELPEARQHLRKVDIDPEAVTSLQDELRRAGVTAVTLFPDLDGLSRYLRSVYGQRAAEKRDPQ